MPRSQIQNAGFVAGLFALAAIAFAAAASASTITVFTNFGTSQSFNTSATYAVSGSDNGGPVYGMSFTAVSTADLEKAVLALGNIPGTANSPITLDLESDAGDGLPGTILATLTQQGTISSSFTGGLTTFDFSGASVELTSGTTYWLVALETNPNSSQYWFFSNNDLGVLAYNYSGSAVGPWAAVPGTNISAFQVDGTTPASAAEPGSFVLLALALLIGLGWIAAKRKRHLA